jgi:hypothetical protein
MHGDAGISSQPTKALWASLLAFANQAAKQRKRSKPAHMDVRLTGAPLGASRWAANSPKGGSQGCEPGFRQGRTPCRKPRSPPAVPKDRMSVGRAHWGCPSLWLLSLGQARESDSVAPRPKAPQAMQHPHAKQTSRKRWGSLTLITNLQKTKTPNSSVRIPSTRQVKKCNQTHESVKMWP